MAILEPLSFFIFFLACNYKAQDIKAARHSPLLFLYYIHAIKPIINKNRVFTMIDLMKLITNASAQIQAILIIAMLSLCWNIERIAGLSLYYKKWNHARLNAKFVLTNMPLELVVGLAFAKTLQWTHIHHFGFIYKIPYIQNKFILLLATFLFLDFGEYVYHILMHKIKRLWMFHVVHHSDSIVDVSTTLREHPGENLIRNSFTLLWVFLSGTLFWALIIRQIIQIISNSFAHINYRLPDRVDSILSILLITPNLHHVHHHYMQPYTDCNYGDVLSIWDRMFGTFTRLGKTKVIFGIDTYMNQKDNSSYKSLIKIPFGKYRKNKNNQKTSIQDL